MHAPQPGTRSFTPQQEAILSSLSQGANRTTACHAADLPRRTFYNWIKADPAFSEAVEEAEAESIGVAEDLAYACAMKAIEDPRYLRALFFWLKHRAGWVQARPEPTSAPPPTHSAGAQHAAPSSDAPSPVSSTDAPLVDTDDFASVMNLIKEVECRSREDEEFMRGYEEWKLLSEEEREVLRLEDEQRITLRDPGLSGDGTPEENPVIGVPFVPSDDQAPAQQINGRGTQVACPLPAPTSTDKPVIDAPSVPPENTEPVTRNTKPSSSKRDRTRQQRFRKKRRR